MSAKSDNSKIVNLPSRQPMQQPIVERLGEPLKTVRDLTLKHITNVINTLFENIDDSLFGLAEHAAGDNVHAEYFDAMREVRKKRQQVERVSLERVNEVFGEFAFARIVPPKATSGEANSAEPGLSLIDDQDLEEALAVTGIIAKAESRLGHGLYPLNRRLSAIRGVPVENNTNPIGPAQLCGAFQTALGLFELNLQAKLIAFKLLDRHLIPGLELLYEEVNALLIQAGVLPQLRLRVPHSSNSGPAAGTAASAASTGTSSTSQYVDGGYAGDAGDMTSTSIEAEIYQTLRSLLALRHQTAAPMMRDGGGTGIPVLGPTDLLSALQILQSQSLLGQSQHLAGETASTNARQLKQALLEQADKLQAGTPARVANVDEDTIDLVGMLFEFIVQDRDIPAQIQALLGRLQIPFLKVALLDRHLFTHKTHPARLLLDNMAMACVGKSEESQADQPLYEKIKGTVESILREFDDDLGLIERANKEFSDFVAAAKRRAELTERRTAEAARGREKLDYARHLAASEMKLRCEGKGLPALFHTLLVGPWAQYLVLVALRQGESSAEWKQALNFADVFILSAAPNPSEADKLSLRSLLPSMYEYLRQGLATVAYQGDDVQRLLQELHEFHQGLIEPAAKPAAAPAASIAAPEAGAGGVKPSVAAIVGMMEKSALRGDVETGPEPASADPVCIDQIKMLEVGHWVEFSSADGDTRQHAKLSWISPISSKYLFVDRKGLKIAYKSAAALAAELGAGTLLLLQDDPPLFDRAMGAIVEQLKSAQVGNAEPKHTS